MEGRREDTFTSGDRWLDEAVSIFAVVKAGSSPDGREGRLVFRTAKDEEDRLLRTDPGRNGNGFRSVSGVSVVIEFVGESASEVGVGRPWTSTFSVETTLLP